MKYRRWRALIVIAGCLVLVGISMIFDAKSNISLEKLEWSFPPHFHYKGGYYSACDGYEYTLPEDFKYMGATKIVEKNGEKENPEDFDSNLLDGYVYMSETDSNVAYFKWKHWDKAVDERGEPYIVYTLYEDDDHK